MYMPTWPGPEDEILRACPVSSPKRRQSASSAEHRKDSGFRSLGDPTTLTDTRTHTYTHICAPARALTHHKHTHTLTRSLTPSHAHLPAPPGAPSPPVLIIILILTRGESPSLLALALEPSMESHCAPSPNARCTSASPWAWYLDLDKALGGSPCKTSRLFLESIKFRHSIARPPRLICLHARLSVRLSASLPVSLPARRPACGLPACLPVCFRLDLRGHCSRLTCIGSAAPGRARTNPARPFPVPGRWSPHTLALSPGPPTTTSLVPCRSPGPVTPTFCCPSLVPLFSSRSRSSYPSLSCLLSPLPPHLSTQSSRAVSPLRPSTFVLPIRFCERRHRRRRPLAYCLRR